MPPGSHEDARPPRPPSSAGTSPSRSPLFSFPETDAAIVTPSEPLPEPAHALPRWMHQILLAASVLGVVLGAAMVFVPEAVLGVVGGVVGGEAAGPLALWRGLGLFIGLFGVAYGIAATDPVRYWPIVFVGLLAKLFVPLGFATEAATGTFPWSLGGLFLVSDVIWLVPFTLILREVSRRRAAVRPWDEDELLTALAGVSGRDQHSLLELSFQGPLLFVFLRHFGCTFCRETLADLAQRQPELSAEGVSPVLVHMSDESRGQVVFSHYGLEQVHRIADPSKALYRAFGLGQGSATQLFGLRVMGRALFGGAVARHGFGGLEGDGFQMPGAFLVRDGRIVRSWRASHAGEKPAWATLVSGEATSASAA